MSEQKSFTDDVADYLKTFEKTAGDFFETLTDVFVGEAESLRDGTEFEPVSLPRDLAAHKNVQTEWWYYTGHGETISGRRFGFELVFFKRRTDLDKFSLVPLRLFGNPIYFAHFALTDITNDKFRYAHRKSANGWFDPPASASEKHFHLRLGDWSLRESQGAHVLRATIGGEVFEATLKPVKKPVLNGIAKDGVSFKDEGQASRYFSYTRMEMEGDLVLNDETEHFHGAAWMDREFGTWTPTSNQKGWDWFSIQLSNNTELMCYQIRDADGNASPFSSGNYIEAGGESTPLGREDFTIEPTGFWKSPKTQATYPSGWTIKAAKYNLELEVTPVLADQELDTRGTTMIIYWEGACDVKGKIGAENVSGRAYVELVGYDRSHEQPNLAYFLMGNSFVG
ncbi:MAG: carotenoid 1,2-hydratase [Acidobacteria bacterium]|jgi:predicted secreted hydrolase|nr:carotenoid 1,2-hydratase [Acidobacteriota bacterium]